jgi:arylsulfatase A-like enzyme
MDDSGHMTKFDTPSRPDWVKGRFDSVITRAPGMPAGGGPSEADMSDKPEFMQQVPEPNQAELTAMTNVARQRAEAVYVLDQEVGGIVQELRDTHEWGNTILMFTSDNGYFMGEHRRRTGKIMAQEPSLRVPFLVTGPGMRQAAKRYDPISTVDITATIIDLAHAERFRDYVGDGMSKRDTFYSGDQGWTVPIQDEGRIGNAELLAGNAPGFDDPRNTIGIRTPRYSFIEYRTGEMELYDLKRDPNQLHSMATNPTYAKRLDALDRLWWRFKDCKGLSCHATLPRALRATKAEERRLTKRYWTGVHERYQDAL